MRWALRRQCKRVLQQQFGVSGFRPGQEEAADALLNHRDLLCILPTGAGKSLCWQLPAVMTDGLTVVLSPLIVLMHDQGRHLQAKGIPCVSLDSLMTPEERNQNMQHLLSGKASIVFIAPERLNNAAFRTLCKQRPPKLLVVDEAHCIVQWGTSFRPAYQQIGQFIATLPTRPTVCAMTATADATYQQDIIASLGLVRPQRVSIPVERENLHYNVLPTVSTDATLLRLLSKVQGKAVVFCRLRRRCEQVADMLNSSGIPAAPYHAGLTQAERNKALQDYLSGAVRVITATSAFGMGVDIPDIRLVIHDHIPATMIDYVQQAGRAGRDGEISHCVLLFTPMNLLRIHNHFQRLRRQSRNSYDYYVHHVRSEWPANRQMLQWMLRSKCLSQGISAAFGQRSKPCGHCSACKKGRIGGRIPFLPRISYDKLCLWILQQHRNQLERTMRLPHTNIFTLYQIARTLVLPKRLPARESYVPYCKVFHDFRP